MAKYKVLQPFRDKYTKEEYEKDQVIEMTVKRADEAIENLKAHDGEFLERIDNKENKGSDENKETESKEKDTKKEGD